MDAARQKDAIEALQDGSRWIIGLGFTAGAGCVVLFRDAAEGPARSFLLAGIAAFALSVLAGIFLRHALARTVERLPLTGAQGKPESVYDHRPGGGLSIGMLARVQLVLVVLGALSVLGWVILLPAR